MQFSKLVLPAPFGPIKPLIAPACTSTLTPSRAQSPPKNRLTPCTDSSLSMRLPYRERRDAPKEREKPPCQGGLPQKQHGDDDRGVQGVGQVRLLFEHLLQRSQESGAHDDSG